MLHTVRRVACVAPLALRAQARPALGGGWSVTSQRFFWWSKDDHKEKKEEEQQETDEHDSGGESEHPEAEVVNTETAVASVGRGEHAPRHPQVIALPSLTRPLFPGFMMPLTVADEATMHSLVELKRNQNPWVGVFLVRNDDDEPRPEQFSLDDVDQLHRVGTFAHIQNIAPTPDGLQIMLMAHRRIRITDVVNKGPPMRVQVHHVDSTRDNRNNPTVKAYTNEILATIREIIKLNPMFKEHVQYFMQTMDLQDSWRLADFAASLTTSPGTELQEVLEAENLEVRLNKALVLLKKEKDLSQLQQDINKEVEQRIHTTNRKFFLHEQLKSIKKELGMEKDDKDALSQKFTERAEGLDMPASARVVFDEELEKLASLERNSAEFNVTRTYLEWLTSIPWGKFSKDNLDIRQARDILDADHYGLSDVKDRILEFIAVGKLKGSVQGKILCLVGPPGVGKTSIGKSVARSLNREFFRFSVGGLSDVAEIKGHRRTYVGAMPGKLIQCMKTTGVSNPLVLIDEIDKIGRGSTGDPASALLEMLDPSQNGAFMDHYLDTPVDASKVLFLCTANVLDTIPGPLLDRMEVIRLSGYDAPEKLQIAKQYLDPKIREELGLGSEMETTPSKLTLDDSAIQDLIRWHCRESGVRNLEKHIEKLYRKVALQVANKVEEAMATREAEAATVVKAEVEPTPSDPSLDAARLDTLTEALKQADTEAVEEEDNVPPALVLTRAEIFGDTDDEEWVISSDNLEDFVGKRVFSSDRLYDDTPPGVVMGLAWTSMGGSALYIEVTTPVPLESLDKMVAKTQEDAGVPSGGRIKLTGQMGDVMSESAEIAHTVSRKVLRSHFPDNAFLEVAPIHLHVPEGATPKDGPSAGCTMVTAMLSLAMGRPVAPNLAMTGEITLGGKILPVGGIKEKTMAARRSGVTTLVFPEGCRKDVEELPDHLTEGLSINYASTYDDVMQHAFPGLMTTT